MPHVGGAGRVSGCRRAGLGFRPQSNIRHFFVGVKKSYHFFALRILASGIVSSPPDRIAADRTARDRKGDYIGRDANRHI